MGNSSIVTVPLRTSCGPTLASMRMRRGTQVGRKRSMALPLIRTLIRYLSFFSSPSPPHLHTPLDFTNSSFPSILPAPLPRFFFHLPTELSEYGEFNEQAFEQTLLDEGTNISDPTLHDEGEAAARRRAYQRHLSRSCDESTSGRPELKRRQSRTDLKRQLSKQLSIKGEEEAEKKDEGASPSGVTLIAEEKAETGMVSLRLSSRLHLHFGIIIMHYLAVDRGVRILYGSV